jgi:metal-responsive CopG/Arc/MetJ family transcriptional regulator
MLADKRKAKITITLNPEIVHQLDALTKASKTKSRSRVVEEALSLLLREHAKRVLDRETEDYYRSLSIAERNEDRKWSKISALSAKHFWDD